ncbi:hypothetical protein JCM17960_14130 [Magnetospira thiophila]
MSAAPISQSDRAFGLTFVAVFLIIAGVAWYFFDVLAVWALVCAGVFFILALLLPISLLPLNRLWAGFAHRLGGFNNHLLLGLFYGLFMVPLGGLMRLFGWDPLRRSFMSEDTSYWTPVTRKTDAETLHDLF